MDPRFLAQEGTGIFTGNELIVKGALESGVGEITGYPGSPLAELFDTLESIRDLLDEQGITAQIANNEALAAARLNGAQMAEVRAMAVMKSVGLHVAADGLALGNMAGASAKGGALVVVGDDTWSEGTQVPADSRFLSQHLYIPVIEPATFQEIKDWVGTAFDLSQQSGLFLTYLVTSNQADGGGSVEVGRNRFPALNRKQRTTIDTSTIASDERVIIPPVTTVKEQEVIGRRYPRLLELARQRNINQILYPAPASQPIGFITSGLAYTYLEHALHILGLSGRFPILKLGITYPIDAELVRDFAAQARQFCIVEEKRPYIEPQVASILTQLRQDGQVGEVPLWGKHFPGGQPGFPDTMGIHPSMVVECLLQLFDQTDGVSLNGQHQLLPNTSDAALLVPARTPSFCPGCPHRDSALVMKKTAEDFANLDFMQARGKEAMDLVFHGDIGCYSMLKYAPFSRLMHNLSGMGLGGGTGAGIDPFIDNKQLVFMGDSTFFHTGMIAISDAIKNCQDITFVILDNKTTAMTGHQPTPGVDVDILGKATFAQDIERVVGGLAADSDTFIARMNPAQRQTYEQLIQEALVRPGVKIIIADKECGITYHRRERARRSATIKEKGFLPTERHINIVEDVCEYCLECTRSTGCSGLTINERTEYGPKVAVDLSSCVTDGACTRVEVARGDKTCPSFEEIVIHRREPPRVDLPPIDVGALPEPKVPTPDKPWYAYVGGVGGMGINVVASVLAQAGVRQGYDVRLTNKKGLAIRNGSVYSHLSYAPKGQILSPLTPAGGANLLLGLDILEAARGLDPEGRHKIASPDCTAAVVNMAKTPTVETLLGERDFSPQELVELIRQHTCADQFFGADLFRICETYLGNKLYANIMMLGATYQLGLLPLDLEHLQWAIKVAVRRDYDTNMKAFDMGRRLAIDPNYFEIEEPEPTFETLLAEKTDLLHQTHNARTAERYRSRVEEILANMDLDEETRRHFALRVYDLIQYDNFAGAERYIALIEYMYEEDAAELGYRATRAAVRYLAKAMIIKDEIYVAHLLTCPEKYHKDRARYNIDPQRGDRIVYRHLNRPHFRLFGRDFRPDLKMADWQLRLVARMKILRRLFASWWHIEERAFTDWYEELIDRFHYDNASEYATWVQVLSLPEEVRGYRSVRRPKMQAARRRAEELLEKRPPVQNPQLLTIEPLAPISS